VAAASTAAAVAVKDMFAAVVKCEVNLPCHHRGTALAIKGKPEQRSNNPKEMGLLASITWLPKRPLGPAEASEVIMLMTKKAASLRKRPRQPQWPRLTTPKTNRIMTSKKSRFFFSLTAAVNGTNLPYFSDHE
jgi:hypothetical protein